MTDRSDEYYGPMKEVEFRVVVKVAVRTKACDDYDNDRVAADALELADTSAREMATTPRFSEITGAGFVVRWTGARIEKHE